MSQLSHKTAQDICQRLCDRMDQLVKVVDEESQLVRAGKLFAAAQLKSRQAYLVRRYSEEIGRLQAMAREAEALAPDQMEEMRREHEGFRALLRINLAALAAARELAETQVEQLAARAGMRRQRRDQSLDEGEAAEPRARHG